MSHVVAVVVVVAAIAVISFGGDEAVVDEAQTLTATIIQALKDAPYLVWDGGLTDPIK